LTVTEFFDVLACPRDGSGLSTVGNRISCEQGHSFPVVDGIPVLLLPDKSQTHRVAGLSIRDAYFPAAAASVDVTQEGRVDAFVQQSLVLVCGQLYRTMVGQLPRYPKARLRLPAGNGQVLLDIGCSWGRWTLAAARLGYRALGVDPNLDAVRAARRIADAEGLSAEFVVADARFLPVRRGAVDVAFSYSVLQHFSRTDVRLALLEIKRVLSHDGFSMIQMANAAGVRSLYQQARRHFREAEGFDVRYWSQREMVKTFSELIGPSHISPDCYFGLGVQPDDADILPRSYQVVVHTSEAMVWLSRFVPGLSAIADSVYVTSKQQHGGRDIERSS